MPSAVVDFEATEVGSKSIKFKWNPPVDPNGNIEAYTLSFQGGYHYTTCNRSVCLQLLAPTWKADAQ